VDDALAARAAGQPDRADRSAVRVPAVVVRMTGEARAQPAHRKVRARPALRTEPRRTPGPPARATAHRQPEARPAPRSRVASVAAGARAGASRVLAYAYRQIGKPYRHGAAGPGAFDCSGLTMRAFAAAGIELPHKASRQRGHTVSASEARAGDLVKWGGYHVGIYAGNGYVIHAPKPRDRVKKARLWGAYRFVRLL
jgi:cell wall-associated NlpC family hydrolase